MSLRKCSKCGVSQEPSAFQLYKGHPNGQCRACKTKSEKLRRARVGIKPKNMSAVSDGQKLCTGCKGLKPFSDFSPAARGLAGLATCCKACTSEAARERGKDGRGRKYTAEYRKRHRARHLANHRVRMYERMHKIKVTSDGTVTDAFLVELYKTEHCHYCEELTPEPLRTADHRVSLAAGGPHSAENLVMACHRCNSSKRHLSELEFLERIKNERN